MDGFMVISGPDDAWSTLLVVHALDAEGDTLCGLRRDPGVADQRVGWSQPRAGDPREVTCGDCKDEIEAAV